MASTLVKGVSFGDVPRGVEDVDKDYEAALYEIDRGSGAEVVAVGALN